MQKVYKFLDISKFLAISMVLLFSIQAKALEEIGSDSRIRTLIYGKNDVFRINSTYGFQTVLELEPNEKLVTISVGNPNIFKIIPSQNRLFIKALQNGQITNMTVITDIRTYQFELTSSTENPEDVMYVVRFIYTDQMAVSEGANSPMNLNLSTARLLPSQNNNAPTASPMNSMGAIPSASHILDQGNFNELNSVLPPASDAPLSMQYKPSNVNNGDGNLLNIPTININSPQM